MFGELLLIVSVIISSIDCNNNTIATIDDDDDVITYLKQYGYLNISGGDEDGQFMRSLNIDSTEVQLALHQFQTFNHLPIDNRPSSDVIQLMQKVRCGVHDVNYQTHLYGWPLQIITWDFKLASPEVLKITTVAFSIWAKYIDMQFEYAPSSKNPQILISFQDKYHNYEETNRSCPFHLVRGAIAHAYYPQLGHATIEMHINKNYDFYLGLDYMPKNKKSLFVVILHEIGHTLGIYHSSVNDSIMTPVYGDFNFNFSTMELPLDDVQAIQSLYGKKTITTTSTSTTTTTTTTTAVSTTSSSTTPKPRRNHPDSSGPTTKTSRRKYDLCALSKLIDTFVIIDRNLHVFYKKYMWVIPLGQQTYDDPILVRDWLTFLPANFERINAIYQRSNGDIALFENNNFYVISSLSLQRKVGYPRSTRMLGLRPETKVYGAINSYKGITYVFYDKRYFMILDECTFTVSARGLIGKTFSNITSEVIAVAKYTNGNLYFFNRRNVYEYNEFSGVLRNTGEKTLSLFDIYCPYQQHYNDSDYDSDY